MKHRINPSKEQKKSHEEGMHEANIKVDLVRKNIQSGVDPLTSWSEEEGQVRHRSLVFLSAQGDRDEQAQL